MNVRCLFGLPNSLYVVFVLSYHRLLCDIFKQGAPRDDKPIIMLLYAKLKNQMSASWHRKSTNRNVQM